MLLKPTCLCLFLQGDQRQQRRVAQHWRFHQLDRRSWGNLVSQQWKPQPGWWQLNDFFTFSPKIGEEEPSLTSIFFKWLETTNQFFISVWYCSKSNMWIIFRSHRLPSPLYLMWSLSSSHLLPTRQTSRFPKIFCRPWNLTTFVAWDVKKNTNFPVKMVKLFSRKSWPKVDVMWFTKSWMAFTKAAVEDFSIRWELRPQETLNRREVVHMEVLGILEHLPPL